MDGEIDGKGIRYFSQNGSKYSGQFVRGEFHGRGTMTYADGSTYEGEWYRNRKHGERAPMMRERERDQPTPTPLCLCQPLESAPTPNPLSVTTIRKRPTPTPLSHPSVSTRKERNTWIAPTPYYNQENRNNTYILIKCFDLKHLHNIRVPENICLRKLLLGKFTSSMILIA